MIEPNKKRYKEICEKIQRINMVRWLTVSGNATHLEDVRMFVSGFSKQQAGTKDCSNIRRVAKTALNLDYISVENTPPPFL